VLTVLALAAAALAIATAPSTSKAAVASEAQTTVIDGDTVPTVGDLGPTTFTKPGPFAAGEATLTLPSDGAQVEVWYPASPGSVKGVAPATYNLSDWLHTNLKALLPAGYKGVIYPTGAYRGVPAAQGRFPLVVFSHGYSGYRDQSSFLTSRLATWGFVVAAPDFLASDLTALLSGKTGTAASDEADLAEQADTISLMGSENARHSSTLHNKIDLSKVAAVGHSLGGAVSEAAAASDARITTFIGLAGATVGSFGQTSTGAGSKVPDKPGMLMVGTSDHVVGAGTIASAYRAMVIPKRLITLTGAGHLVFADICQLAPGQGGLLAAAAAIHLSVPASLVPLASDGCSAPDTPVTDEWPVVRQAVTAQLRWVFGFDATQAGLTGLVGAFPGRVSLNVSSG
jgi:predicted dienelactone hydrolase